MTDSKVPRGMTRHFVLSLIAEKPMNGKEIKDKARELSGDKWDPSSGLVYPLLGRLADSGFIVENEDGRFAITDKGRAIVKDAEAVKQVINDQVEVAINIAKVGKYAAENAVDMATSVLRGVSKAIPTLPGAAKAKYKSFLKSELDRIG